MPTAFQPSPVEPARFYDAPAIALNQVLSDSATMGSLLDTFVFDSANLSPIQRRSAVQGLKDSMGNHTLTNAMVDIVTNPFVWAGLLFSPAGGTAALAGGKLFFETTKNSILPHAVKTGWYLLEGTAGGKAFHQMMRKAKDLANAWQKDIEPFETAHVNALKEMGLIRSNKEWLKPHLIQDPAKRMEVMKLHDAIQVRAQGLDLDDDLRGLVSASPQFRYERAVPGSPDLMPINPLESQLSWLEKGDAGTWVDAGPVRDQKQILRLWQETKKMQELRGGDFQGVLPVPAEFREGMPGDELLRVRVLPIREGITKVRMKSERPLLMPFGDRPEVIDAFLAKYPTANALIEGIHKGSNRHFVNNYLKDSVTLEQYEQVLAAAKATPGDTETRREAIRQAVKPLLDAQKVVRQRSGYEEYGNNLVRRHLEESGLGDVLLHPEVQKGIANGGIPRELYDDILLDAVLENAALEHYFPHNTHSFWTKAGGELRKLKPAELDPGGEPADLLRASGRAHGREKVDNMLTWDPDTLRGLQERWGPSENLKKLADNAEAQILNASDIGQRYKRTFTMDLVQAMEKYNNQMIRDHILFVEQPDARTVESMKAIFQGTTPDTWPAHYVGGRALQPGAWKNAKLMQPLDPAMNPTLQGPGGWRMVDAIAQSGYLLAGGKNPERAKQLLEETLLPTVLGTKHHHHGFIEANIRGTQWLADKAMNSEALSFIPRMLERGGDLGKQLVHRLRVFADQELSPASSMAPKVLGHTAGYLYGTHLGFNFGSVLLNLQQPFLHLSTYVGGENVLRAYPDVIREMGQYFDNRMKLFGARMITPAERRIAIEGGTFNGKTVKAAFEFPEEVDIMGHIIEDVDRMAFKEGGSRVGGIASKAFIEAPLKFFEKAEWMNRLASVHALKHAYVKAGKLRMVGNQIDKTHPYYATFKEQAHRLTQETQFGTDVLNTPLAFLDYSFLANPLIRQFQTFSLRSPLAFLHLGPTLREGKRAFGFQRFGGPQIAEAPWWVGDTARFLGTSAFIYELGKNLLGVDLSKGGSIAAMTDILGGERFLDNDSFIPQPPIANMSMNYIKGVMGGDSTLLGNAIARSIPGGVAIQRAMGVLPQAEGSFANLASVPSLLQKTWADYSNPLPDGRIPLYKGTGELIDYRTPTSLVFQGLGVDLGKHRHAQDFDHWYQQQRDTIVNMRREAINAVLSNNVSKALRIRDQFERKYGLPLTWTRSQIKSAIRNRTTPRTERMLDRMPKDARQMFLEVAKGEFKRLGFDKPEDLTSADTALRRTLATGRDRSPMLDPESIKALQQFMQGTQSQEAPIPIEERSFAPFRGYTVR